MMYSAFHLNNTIYWIKPMNFYDIYTQIRQDVLAE